MARRYFSHRRAYAPRIWPVLAGILPPAVALTTWLDASTLGDIAISVALGAIAMKARWWIWRRRHPIITPGQYIDDLQRKARWN